MGTVWVIFKSAKTFDAEDARLVTHISALAALAYQALTTLGDMELLSKAVQLMVDGQFARRGMVMPRKAAWGGCLVLDWRVLWVSRKSIFNWQQSEAGRSLDTAIDFDGWV